MKMVVGVFKTHARARDVLYKLQTAGFDPQGVTVITGDQPSVENADVGNKASATESDLQQTAHNLEHTLLVPGMNAIQGIAQPLREPLEEADIKKSDILADTAPTQTQLPKDFHQTLARWGLTDAQIRDYETQVASGSILVAVQAVDDRDIQRVEQILHYDGAGDVSAAASAH